MIDVSTAELKARLSKYLRLVREGTVVYVTSHRQRVARLSASGQTDAIPIQAPVRPMADIRKLPRLKPAKSVDALRVLLEDRATR